MSSDQGITSLSAASTGKDMHRFMAELYPVCRSITGNGLRETLRAIGRYVPLQIHEVPSGTKAFDWTVPLEWNIQDAYVKDEEGRRVIDFRSSNLHVVNYSIPVKKRMTLSELRPHLHSIPDHPGWIPYRTSYYEESWGFCLTHNILQALKNETYEVCIDSTLKNGSMSYGEYVSKGSTDDEVLFSCHACHPSLCNDNLSGIVLSTFLARLLSGTDHRYTYRFLFLPGTIGSITWLSLNEKTVGHIKHGLVVACVGDSGAFTYKKSRRSNAEIDRAVLHALIHSGASHEVLEFSPYGYDERQYCSPGFNLPVGSLTRSPNHRFPEYHTSADNLEFVSPESLEESMSMYLRVISILENNRAYLNQNPKCEPQLGKRGLYHSEGGKIDLQSFEMAALWVLNLSDGTADLLDIAERSGMEFGVILRAAAALAACDLLLEVPEKDQRRY